MSTPAGSFSLESDPDGPSEPVVSARLRTGLEVLWTAAKYAQSTGFKDHDFAVELDDLLSIGMSRNDIRWLVAKAYVAHVREVAADERGQRRFEAGEGFSIDSTSCFVLSALGAEFVRLTVLEPRRIEISGEAAVARPEVCETVVDQRPRTESNGPPRWDVQRRELWGGTVLVKRFRVPAPRQELVLTVFQEENWPARIDDPLPPQPEIDPKRQLHAVISSLNRNQKNSLLIFSGDGNGTGILWRHSNNEEDRRL